MNILAVDPGVQTGWAVYQGGRVHTAGEDDQQTFCELAEDWLEDRDPYTKEYVGSFIGAVVCENYRITAETIRKTRQTASLEIIGWLRGLCWKYRVEFVLQTPGDAKGFMSDAKLRALGWRRGGAGHADDALRHLGLYLAKVEHNEAVLRAGL